VCLKINALKPIFSACLYYTVWLAISQSLLANQTIFV
jgi:hypothetical protein